MPRKGVVVVRGGAGSLLGAGWVGTPFDQDLQVQAVKQRLKACVCAHPHPPLHAARSSPNIAAAASGLPSAPPLPPYPDPTCYYLHSTPALSAGGAAASPGGLAPTAPGTPSYMSLPVGGPSPSPATAAADAAAAAAASCHGQASPSPYQRLSSPGWPPHLPAHVPLPPPHSASSGGAAPVGPGAMPAGPSSASSTHLPPPPTAAVGLSAAAAAASTSRVTRTTVDDVEAGTHDQAATSGGSGSGGGGRAGGSGVVGGPNGHGPNKQPTTGSVFGAAVAASTAAAAAAAVAAEEGTSALTPGALPVTATAAAAAGMAEVPAGAAAAYAAPPAPLRPMGSRVEVSVSVLEPEPSLGRPVSPSGVELATLRASAAAGGASTAAAAAVGVPILLLSAGSAGAAAAAAAASGPVVPGVVLAAGVPAPEPGVDGVDVVATLLASGAPRRRLGTSGGGGTDLDETSGGGAAADDGDGGAGGGGGDVGQCALPAEVRRRLRSHLGRHRMKHIRSWKDLAHSTASPRPGYWLLGTLALLAVLLTAFYFMAGQWEFLRPIDVAGPAEALAPPPPPPPAGTAVGSSVALGEPSSGAGVNMTTAFIGNLTAVPNMGTAGSSTASAATTSSLNVAAYNDPYSHNWGPDALWDWLAFWRPNSARTFGFAYLRAWGGRYCPDLAAGQWWRWLTGLLLHQSALHLVSNTALLLVLATYLESLYGCWRVLPVFFVAGIAGNMVSSWLEDPCTLVVGASGAVFGLLGAYTADAGLNWESIPLLWLRLAGMGLVVGFMLALQLADHSRSGSAGAVSHASHAGGFVAGLLMAWLLLPDFKARRAAKVTQLLSGLGLESHLPPPDTPPGRQLYSFWQRHRVLTWGVHGVAVSVLVLQLVAVPAYLYTHTFKHLDCGAGR